MSFLRLSRQARRGYATVAQASGVPVFAQETGAAGTTSISVVVKAGSKFEPAPGVAHVLKSFAFKSTDAGSSLKTARETELYGGVLSTGLSREHLVLNAEFLKGDEEHFLGLLASVLGGSKFLEHEYKELVLPLVQGEAEAAAANPVATAIEAANQVAFRRGLGNSLFAEAHSPVSLESVKSYAQQAFAKSNIAVIGRGISTEALAAAVEKTFGAGSAAGASSLSAPKTAYFGGEKRIQLDSHSQPTLVIAYGQAGASTPELQVLQQLLGGEAALKWSAGLAPFSQAAAKVQGASAQAFLNSYEDASLFGVVIQAPTDAGVRAVAEEVAAAIKGASKASDEDVKRAVAKAKFADATKFESQASLVEAVAPAVLAGQAPAAASFDGVSTSALAQAAEKLFGAKPTVVAVGNTHVLPYADELGL